MDLPLSPSALFSPSKAAQQRAQAQDWRHVDSWLTARYATSHSRSAIPAFERNDATLSALLTLSAANERADEEEAEVARLEAEAVRERDDDEETDTAELDAALLDLMASRLTPDGQTSLDALAQLTWALEASDASPETLAHALLTHSLSHASLTTRATDLAALVGSLQTELAITSSQLDSLRAEPALAASAPPALTRRTTDYARQTKTLRTKLREYEDRLSALPPASSSDALARRLADREGELRALRERVEGLEDEVEEFGGLPPEREAARRDVEKRARDLDALRARRDGLFEGLVDG